MCTGSFHWSGHASFLLNESLHFSPPPPPHLIALAACHLDFTLFQPPVGIGHTVLFKSKRSRPFSAFGVWSTHFSWHGNRNCHQKMTPCLLIQVNNFTLCTWCFSFTVCLTCHSLLIRMYCWRTGSIVKLCAFYKNTQKHQTGSCNASSSRCDTDIPERGVFHCFLSLFQKQRLITNRAVRQQLKNCWQGWDFYWEKGFQAPHTSPLKKKTKPW